MSADHTPDKLIAVLKLMCCEHASHTCFLINAPFPTTGSPMALPGSRLTVHADVNSQAVLMLTAAMTAWTPRLGLLTRSILLQRDLLRL